MTTQGDPSQARVFRLWHRLEALQVGRPGSRSRLSFTVQGDGGVTDVAFVLAFSEEGSDAAKEDIHQAQDAQGLLKRSRDAYQNCSPGLSSSLPSP